MTPYSFWCSKCKVEHAGECPPALKSEMQLTKEQLDGLNRALGGPPSAPPGTQPKVFGKITPLAGTRWVTQEDWNDGRGFVTHNHSVWTVVSVNGADVLVKDSLGTPVTTELEAFQTHGVPIFKGSGVHWRMVPAP